MIFLAFKVAFFIISFMINKVPKLKVSNLPSRTGRKGAFFDAPVLLYILLR